MKIEYYEDLILYDYEPTTISFREELLWGLKQTPKTIPSKFFYDERGSRLFREITVLEEYYPTRTEMTILRDHLPEMAQLIGPEAQIIEFGTGAGLKTKVLLQALEHPAAYAPIDIAREQLLEAASELVEMFPEIELWPVCADYTDQFSIPTPEKEIRKTVVFFPGSTIGNFVPEDAETFLRNVAKLTGADSGLLIGVDLVKDTETLERAYNDSKGVTAAFNLNLIEILNREFHTNIPTANFAHFAFYNQDKSRIEMHLISLVDQVLLLDSEEIELAEGEHIVTEYSYKYTIASFRELAERAGFSVQRTWTDAGDLFSIHYCTL